MARGRRKKKHICAECGEEFNHGIGLRKHQRQTGHKGSEIVEEGKEPSTPAAPPKQEAPPSPPPQKKEPPPTPQQAPPPQPAPAAAAVPEPAQEEDDQTVAVNRRPTSGEDHTVAVNRQSVVSPQDAPASPQNRKSQGLHETKHKLSVVSSGMKVMLSHQAKKTSKQLKQSARSGADIFREALKLAVALICFLAVPTVVFFWWKSHSATPPAANRPEVFSFDNGALAARSTLLRYLDHLGKERWDDAYSLLSPSWQSEMGPGAFKDAFLDIEDVRWAVSDQKLNPDGNADVLVRLAFQEGGKTRRYVGRFRLLRGTQGWRIDRAELTPDRSS